MFLHGLTHLVAHYGLLGVFVSMLIENIGIPLPTEGAFLVSASFIAHHVHSFWFMYWFIVVSHLVGATTAYWIGRWVDESFVQRLQRFRDFTETHRKIHAWYEKYGSATVLATRLIGYVRPWSSFVAGLALFPFGSFLFWTFIGTLLFVYPTMKVTSLLVFAWDRFPFAHIFISVGLFVSFFGVFIYLALRRRQRDKNSTAA